MYYAKVNDGKVEQYPYTLADLHKDFPNRSFSFPLSAASMLECSIVSVNPVTPPPSQYQMNLVQGTPELNDGEWSMVWEFEPMSEEDAAADTVRLMQEYVDAVQGYMDGIAQQKGYDDIKSAALRAALPNSPFHLEGVAAGEWMDQCWSTCYAILADVQAESREIPTVEEIISELPPFGWPGQ